MIVNDDGTLTLASVGEFAAVTDKAAEVSRREFLKLSGGIGGGLMLALYLRPRNRPPRPIRHPRSSQMPSSASIRTIPFSSMRKIRKSVRGSRQCFP
jgi:hypothetical protein